METGVVAATRSVTIGDRGVAHREGVSAMKDETKKERKLRKKLEKKHRKLTQKLLSLEKKLR